MQCWIKSTSLKSTESADRVCLVRHSDSPVCGCKCESKVRPAACLVVLALLIKAMVNLRKQFGFKGRLKPVNTVSSWQPPAAFKMRNPVLCETSLVRKISLCHAGKLTRFSQLFWKPLFKLQLRHFDDHSSISPNCQYEFYRRLSIEDSILCSSPMT